MTRLVVLDGDPSLATTVRSLVARDAGADVVGAADLAEAADALPDGGVLVVGPDHATRAAVHALQVFHRDHPAVRTVLAYDRKPGAPMRDVVAVGASALVDPADATALRVAVDRALRAAREVVPLGVLGRVDEAPGRVLTVVSATGGCGKTFVAANLASALARWSGARVALVDLDLQFGEVAPGLGLRPRTTWGDLVGASADELHEVLDEVLVTHDSGLRVLAAASDPAVADAIDAELIRDVLDRLRATHDVVVVDTSSGLDEATLTALDVTDEALLLATLDVASIRNLRTLDRTLDRLQVPASARQLVLNEDRAGVGLTADEVERVLDRSFLARIPHSPAVPRATNAGRPVLLDEQDGEVVGPLVELLAHVAPEAHRDAVRSHQPQAAAAAPRGWLPWRRPRTTPVARASRPPVAPLGLVRAEADPTPEA